MIVKGKVRNLSELLKAELKGRSYVVDTVTTHDCRHMLCMCVAIKTVLEMGLVSALTISKP